MLNYTQGNLLLAQTEAIVNTVNTVGVMGKGIALMFRETFPRNMAAYAAACKAGEVNIGTMFVTETNELSGPKWVINFPTKKHWRQPSKLEWIKEGLQDLRKVLIEKSIHSISLPPLGCGNGGLEWAEVKPEIEKALGDLTNIEIVIYEPVGTYQNQPKLVGDLKLTPARAMVAEAVRRYWILGIECTNLEVQKLGWFLERSVETLAMANPFKFQFKADKYGPFSTPLRHLMTGLDGSYLHCNKRLSDAGPLDLIWFSDEMNARLQEYLHGVDGHFVAPVIEQTSKVIDGFESPLGMELLATVDWLLTREGVEASNSAIRAALVTWPGGKEAGERKLRLFDERLIELALNRLVH